MPNVQKFMQHPQTLRRVRSESFSGVSGGTTTITDSVISSPPTQQNGVNSPISAYTNGAGAAASANPASAPAAKTTTTAGPGAFINRPNTPKNKVKIPLIKKYFRF